MIASIPRRIKGLKRLVDEYFHLEKKALIEKHTELLRVFDIRGSKHPKHHHKNVKVYISRKALKHCIERRKEDLSKHHSYEQVKESVYFAIEHFQETIIDFDSYTFEPPLKHFYVKDYSHVGKPSLRVLLEMKEERLEIVSIHFHKNKKK